METSITTSPTELQEIVTHNYRLLVDTRKLGEDCADQAATFEKKMNNALVMLGDCFKFSGVEVQYENAC